MSWYRVLFAFDLLVVLVLIYFFAEGRRYGEPGATLAIWLPILALPVAMLISAWAMRAKGRNKLAMALILLLAIPPALFALFFGVLLAANPSWH